jgi:hypothetical protein
MGGTLTLVVGESRQLSTHPSGCRNGRWQELATCTLLGPEGPGLEGDLETRFLGPRSDRLESAPRAPSAGAVPTVC